MIGTFLYTLQVILRKYTVFLSFYKQLVPVAAKPEYETRADQTRFVLADLSECAGDYPAGSMQGYYNVLCPFYHLTER